MQSLALRTPKGQLFFETENLVIADNTDIRLARIGLGLLAFAMLAVLVKSFEFIDFSSWLAVVSLLGWLLPVGLLYSMRNTSGVKNIKYDQMKSVKYKKAHYGFKQPVLEVLFVNEHELIKKRYIHVKAEQVSSLLLAFKNKSIQVIA